MSAEFDTLMAEYLDGEPDAAALASLHRIVAGDAGLRREFRDQIKAHVLLREVVSEAMAAQGVAAVETERHPQKPAVRIPRRIRPPRGGPAVSRPALPARRSRAGWRLTALAATVLLAVGLAVVLQWQYVRLPDMPLRPGLASLADVTGRVTLDRGGIAQAAVAGQNVYSGDRLSTAGPGAGATLLYADTTRLALSADTTVTLAGRTGTPAPDVRLAKGALLAEVAPQRPGRRFMVATRDAEILVRGTRFRVRVAPDSTHVETLAGRVTVRDLRRGESVLLSAGERALLGAQPMSVTRQPSPGSGPAAMPPMPDGLVALYTFQEGAGTIIGDRSGAGTPLDLSIGNPAMARWLPGGGLALTGPAAIVSRGPAAKIAAACSRVNEVSIELWLKAREPFAWSPRAHPRILANSDASLLRWNFELGCSSAYAPWGTAFVLRLVTSAPGHVPTNPVCTQFISAHGTLSAALTHVIVGRDSNGGVHMYVNGRDATGGTAEYDLRRAEVTRFEPHFFRAGGDLAAWDRSLPLMLGTAPQGERPWLGELYLVAVYARALSGEEAQSQFAAGVPGKGGAAQASIELHGVP
ncbi:MAG: FecR domain-containing protein [Kiritimatiellae bacterium]|nr:FecR domain-containing protein [Kiritimatiellia bacterium]